MSRNRPPRVLELDLDSVRTEQVLRGTWRPTLDVLLAVPGFVLFALFLLTKTGALFPAVWITGIMLLVFVVADRKRVAYEPALEACIREMLMWQAAAGGPTERYEIGTSFQPGRMLVRAGYRFCSKTEVVYGAFLNPNIARQFLFAAPNGTMVRAEINARVGGEFNFVDRRDGVDVLHTGHYTALYWPTLIAFDFCVPMYSSASASVTLELEATVPGCKVMLTCDGVLPEYAESTRDGWERILTKAASVIDEATHDAA